MQIDSRSYFLLTKMVLLTFYETFSHRIGSLLRNCLTDATLLVEREEIPVHKCILAAQSSYFMQIFCPENYSRGSDDSNSAGSSSQNDTEHEVLQSDNQYLFEIKDVSAPNVKNIIELKNAKLEVVKNVLEYFYYGHYNYHGKMENHFLALELAHQFGLDILVETLIEEMVKSITMDNFFDFCNLRNRYPNLALENSCINFLMEHGEEIADSEDFSKLSHSSLLHLLETESFTAAEIDIFRAAERWAEVNKPNEKNVRDIVDRIRLATISQKDLLDVVSTSKELPSIDILEPIKSIIKENAASTNFRLFYCKKITDLNVAQSSLGAKLLSGSIIEGDLRSDYSEYTAHQNIDKQDCIVVKLGRTYRLNALKIVLDSSEGRCYKYHIEISVNEKNWIRVIDHSKYWCSSYQFLRFEPKAAKYIKLTGVGYENLNIRSIEAMYSTEKFSFVQGVQVPSTNVSLESKGATVTGDGHYNLKHCSDWNDGSCSVVKQGSPLIIKLGQPYWLSSLQVKINAWGNRYAIDSSPDGESWKVVGVESNGEKGTVWRTFEFSSRVVLYFRVSVKKLNHSGTVGVYYFESPVSTIAATNSFLTSKKSNCLNI